MATTWKDGDVVKLASGGPIMTVTKVYLQSMTNKPLVTCEWVDKDGRPQKQNYPPDALIAATA